MATQSTFFCSREMKIFDINMDVMDGEVVITDRDDIEVNKALATELVTSLFGVKSVENRLAVVTPE